MRRTGASFAVAQDAPTVRRSLPSAYAKANRFYLTQSRLRRMPSVMTIATMEAPTKAMPNDAKIVANCGPIAGMTRSVSAPSSRTIVIRKFLEFLSESFLIAAMPPKTRSKGAVKGTEIKADRIANMMASVLAAAQITFIFSSR